MGHQDVPGMKVISSIWIHLVVRFVKIYKGNSKANLVHMEDDDLALFDMGPTKNFFETLY